MLVAGSIGPSAARMLREAHVEVVPWVEHIAGFYRKVDVIVVPLLSGTGVSVKTIEAAAHGSAIVTTPVGLRGLALRHEEDVLVAEGGESFADSISRLLRDPALRARLGATRGGSPGILGYTGGHGASGRPASVPGRWPGVRSSMSELP